MKWKAGLEGCTFLSQNVEFNFMYCTMNAYKKKILRVITTNESMNNNFFEIGVFMIRYMNESTLNEALLSQMIYNDVQPGVPWKS